MKSDNRRPSAASRKRRVRLSRLLLGRRPRLLCFSLILAAALVPGLASAPEPQHVPTASDSEAEVHIAPDASSGATLSAGHLSASRQLEAAAKAGGSERKRRLKVAVLDTLVNPFDSFYLQATIARLEALLPDYDWQTITVSAAEAREDIARVQPDFLFAPAAFVAALDPSMPASRIATRKTTLAQKAEASVGAAFVVRAGEGLETLDALKGRRAAAGMPMAADGWLAAAGEILEAGYDPDTFFERIDFRTNAYPDVISALLAGRVDVAILPACLLETVGKRMLVDVEGLSIAAEKNGGLACRHSTALYPDVTLLALSHALERAVRDVTVAILSERNAREYEWLTNVSFSEVLRLFEALQLGPYAYLRDMSAGAIFERHRSAFLLAAAAILFLVLNELRLQRLVRRRTHELARSMAEREREAANAEAVRRRLALFERRSIVQQMSGMIAHEINAPIGAIRTFAAILRMSDPTSASAADAGGTSEAGARARKTALEGIEREAVRIAEIVARVRRYAKTTKRSHEAVDLRDVLSKSVRALKAERPTVRVDLSLKAASPANVLGDGLELELLFLNLLRNAVQAADSQTGANGIHMASERRQEDSKTVPVCVSAVLREEAEGSRYVVVIENPGAPLGEEVIKALNSRASGFVRAMREEMKEENDVESMEASSSGASQNAEASRGLGLGLTICRGIADSHGASLRFEAREAGGVRVKVLFDAVLDNAKDQDR